MKKEFLAKCKEIFNSQCIIHILENDISRLTNIAGVELEDEYLYIVSNYSGVFLNDNYEVSSKYHSPIADENGTEPFLYFLGIDGTDNIFDTYDIYVDRLPKNYYPIALADGGNLICKELGSTSIYLWVHDDQNSIYKIFDSIEQMIMMISAIEKEELDSEDLGIIWEELEFSDEFLTALEKAKGEL